MFVCVGGCASVPASALYVCTSCKFCYGCIWVRRKCCTTLIIYDPFSTRERLNYLLSMWCKPSWFALIESVRVQRLWLGWCVLDKQGSNGYIRAAGIRWQLYFGLCAPAKLLGNLFSTTTGHPCGNRCFKSLNSPPNPPLEHIRGTCVRRWGLIGEHVCIWGCWGSKYSDLIIIYSQRVNEFNYAIKSTECRERVILLPKGYLLMAQGI